MAELRREVGLLLGLVVAANAEFAPRALFTVFTVRGRRTGALPPPESEPTSALPTGVVPCVFVSAHKRFANQKIPKTNQALQNNTQHTIIPLNPCNVLQLT